MIIFTCVNSTFSLATNIAYIMCNCQWQTTGMVDCYMDDAV
jgi:hypothetical protein